MSTVWITDHLGHINPIDLNGTIDEAIELLKEEKKLREANGYKDITLFYEVSHCYECSGEGTLNISGRRPETSVERRARLDKSKKEKADKKLREDKAIKLRRQIYEKLKKEFDPPTKFIECKRPKTIEEMQEDAADKRLYGK